MSDSNPRQFIDTNILIYAHDNSARRKRDRAKEIIKGLWEDQNGCLSIQVLQEFYVNITQKVANPLTSGTAVQIIADLATWEIHSPKVDDVLDAIRIQNRYQLSFWDAMIVTSALQLGCVTLWSEDLNPGQAYDSVTVVNPLNGAIAKSTKT